MPTAPTPRRRGRVTAAVACAGLTATLGAVMTPGFTGGAHAAPTEDCATAFPVAELTRGQLVEGLTVSQGATPEAFTGEVLGVLNDGIGIGRDMIMMDLTSPAIDAADGIWQGMSGSPVYAEDGRLIGAVAYGLSWGPTKIAGVTPFEYMDDYLGPAAPAPKRIPVGDKAASRIAATGEATEAQAEQGFEQLPMRFGMTGVSRARLADAKARPYLRGIGPAGLAGTSAGESAASVDTLGAGGNLAAVLSTGDVTYAGVGTVTSVCNGRLVGFGHPMRASGSVAYGLAAADVVHVQPDSLGAPFKASNVGEIGGTIDADRLSGIAGPLGPVPGATTFTSDVTFAGANRVGTTDVLVSDALASVAFGGTLGNHDAVLDFYGPGSETQDWVIKGLDESGEPFTIRYGDRFQSSYDIAYEASYSLADVLYILSQTDAVITSATSTADVTDDDSVYRVRRIQRNVGGTWVDVHGEKLVVKPGATLNLRAVLVDGTNRTSVPYTYEVPKNAADTSGTVEMSGGGSDYLDVYDVDSVAEMKKVLRRDAANDSVLARVSLRGNGTRITDAYESDSLDLVVSGGKRVKLVVR